MEEQVCFIVISTECNSTCIICGRLFALTICLQSSLSMQHNLQTSATCLHTLLLPQSSPAASKRTRECNKVSGNKDTSDTDGTASSTADCHLRKKSRKCASSKCDATFTADDLAEIPPLNRKFYGDCDDYDLCRRIFVKPTITLKTLRQKIHDTYVQNLY